MHSKISHLAVTAIVAISSMAGAAELSPPILLPESHTRDSLLISWKEPDYPAAAASVGVTGAVVVEFDVDINGRLSNTKIVRSQPQGVFDEAVQDTLSAWIVVPYRATSCFPNFPRSRVHVNFQLVDGKPTVTAGQPEPLTDPAGSQIAKAGAASLQNTGPPKAKSPRVTWKRKTQPRYPQFHKIQERIHGDVVARATIAPDGKPEKIQIVFSSPHPAFGESVKESMMSWEAGTVTGEPMQRRAVICQRIQFRPSD